MNETDFGLCGASGISGLPVPKMMASSLNKEV